MLEWGVGHDGSGAMSKALAGNRMVMLDADDAAAVLSLLAGSTRISGSSRV